MLSLRHAPSLRELTTLRLGGNALMELSFTDEEDMEAVAKRIEELKVPLFVLGGGSNILAADGKLPVTLVRPRCVREAEIIMPERCDAGENAVIVRAGAGLPLRRLLRRCSAWGLSGLEGLAGIPGTVGGAVAMNAGSFGCETGRFLHSLRIWSPNGGLENIFPAQWNFAYRNFNIIKKVDYFFLLSASFCLTRAPSNGIREAMRLNYFKKKSTQPLSTWSAGCAFKNPSSELPAGKLLDNAGFKGKRLGGMAFSPLHANFLVNEGKGSANAAFDLLAEARQAVLHRSGIDLQPEIRVLPCP